MKNALPLILCALSILPTWATAVPDASPGQADPLAHLRKGHPRLLATAADFEKLAHPSDDPIRAEVARRVIATAEAMLKAPLTEHKFAAEGAMLGEARHAFHYIAMEAMAYRLTHDERFADRAKKEMLNVSAFPDWNPKHFLDTGELALAVGLGYDWLYDDLTPAERTTIKTALMEKALSFAPTLYGKPLSAGEKHPDKILWWVNNPYNWNQVCNSGLLTAALALADEEPDTARLVVKGVAANLPFAMASYAPDGAWPEGPGYWGYGTTFNVLGLAVLESALGTDLGLANVEPAFRKTVDYRMRMDAPDGKVFNYADAGVQWEGSISPAFGWLAARYGSPETITYYREALRLHFGQRPADKEPDRFFPFSVLWTPPSPTVRPVGLTGPKPDTALDAHYRGLADVAVFRSAWNDPDALFLGFKAGTNGVNHGHLDLGFFMVDADSERWSASLGPDSYDLPQYFGKMRWTYYRLINAGQSTLTPGDQLQDTKAVSPIIAFRSERDKACAVADLTPAYPGAAQKILRGAFMLDRTRVLVQDDLTALAPGTVLNWRMFTAAQIEISGDARSAVLTQHGKRFRAEILSPADAKFSVASARPPTPAENQNEGFTVLLGTVPPRTAAADVRLAVLLTPVGPKWPKDLPPPALSPLPSN